LTPTNAETVLGILSEVLNLCSNSNVSSEIAALQSQASKFASLTTTSAPTSLQTPQNFSTPPPSNATIPTVTPLPAAPSSTQGTTATVPQTLNLTWIVGPIIGSFLGLATVIVVIVCTKRKQRREVVALRQEFEIDKKALEEDSYNSWKPQLHSEDVKPRELEINEVYELAAPEPVGSELSTPRDGNMEPIEEWPLPISPLRALFASSELRDQRIGRSDSPKHETYYNP